MEPSEIKNLLSHEQPAFSKHLLCLSDEVFFLQNIAQYLYRTSPGKELLIQRASQLKNVLEGYVLKCTDVQKQGFFSLIGILDTIVVLKDRIREARESL